MAATLKARSVKGRIGRGLVASLVAGSSIIGALGIVGAQPAGATMTTPAGGRAAVQSATCWWSSKKVYVNFGLAMENGYSQQAVRGRVWLYDYGKAQWIQGPWITDTLRTDKFTNMYTSASETQGFNTRPGINQYAVMLEVQWGRVGGGWSPSQGEYAPNYRQEMLGFAGFPQSGSPTCQA